MKKIGIIGLLSYCVIALVSLVAAAEVVWQDIGGGNSNIKTVLIQADNPRIIYIGSNSGVLKSEDAGKVWRSVLVVVGQNRAVNFLSFGLNNNSVYAASGAGLYYSSDSGKNWKRIFQGKSNPEKECLIVASLPYAILLGTKAGLFVSTDKGCSWHKAKGKLGSSLVLAIASHPKEPDSIYIACVDGVFKSSDRAESWERIFVVDPIENGQDQEETVNDQDEEDKFSEIRYLNIDPNDPNTLYLSTQKGLYISQDKGKTWKTVPSFGLLSREINFLFISIKGSIYAVNRSGIFYYNQDKWERVSFGLVANKVRFLTVDNQNNLYAATEKGLFKTEVRNAVTRQESRLSIYYKDEPGIKEIQQAAIRYAEVSPEKIKIWRKQAAKKAWLPQVSVGLDRNTTDLWHWEGGSASKPEDDILRRGNDSLDWDVRLSWDLSKLIYNDDQTSIDVRSKLMVQLRDDILDEVTKLYFERLRVKMEIDNLNIIDIKKHIEKELKVQELTASIDALTGGYFSEQLKVRP